jgi:hypothetical protein
MGVGGSLVLCGVVWCGVVWCGVVGWGGMGVGGSLVWCGVVWGEIKWGACVCVRVWFGLRCTTYSPRLSIALLF